ncbi:MAG: GTPase domain-containing protein [Myxococcales bacterium]
MGVVLRALGAQPLACGQHEVRVDATQCGVAWPVFLALKPEPSLYFSEPRIRALTDTDAVLLVLDGQVERHEANRHALDELELALASHGLRLLHRRQRAGREFPFWPGAAPPPVYREAAARWRRLLIEKTERAIREVPMVIQLNKIDLPTSRDREGLLRLRSLAFDGEAPPVFETCAVSGQGVMQAFEAALRSVTAVELPR